ncbi:putative F-box protein At4g22165 [Carex rostrata]
MENSASPIPDWANLPLAAVYLISQKVKCITDYVRFRAVCSPWRCASFPNPHLPLQLPWLMIPYSIKDREDDGIRLFYDHWESKMRKIHLPETIGMACCASYRGWLLLVARGGMELFLLNPLTRARIQLPPFPNDFLVRLFLGIYVFSKMTFSADPTDPNCIIMVFSQRFQAIFFCKVGDCCWTEIVVAPFLGAALQLIDAVYYNERFYLLNDEVIYIYDLCQLEVPVIYFLEAELQSLCKYFLIGKSGVYIVTDHYTEDEGGEDAEEATEKAPKQKIVLYQIIEQELGMDVKQIADTNDIAIFYGDNYHYLAVCADDWDSLDRGCLFMEYIYSLSSDYELLLYTDPNEGFEHGSCYVIFYTKLADGKPEPVVFDLGQMPRIWPPGPALWFQPTFM